MRAHDTRSCVLEYQSCMVPKRDSRLMRGPMLIMRPNPRARMPGMTALHIIAVDTKFICVTGGGEIPRV